MAEVWCRVVCGQKDVACLIGWVPRRGDFVNVATHRVGAADTVRRYKVVRVEASCGGMDYADGPPQTNGSTAYAVDVTEHGRRLTPLMGEGWTWDLHRKVGQLVLQWVRDTKAVNRDVDVTFLSVAIIKAAQRAFDENGE